VADEKILAFGRKKERECLWERERERVCVFVAEREREREFGVNKEKCLVERVSMRVARTHGMLKIRFFTCTELM
jgi:hypothetical protein